MEEVNTYPDFRCLYPDEINVRVARCKEYGVQLLLYKDSRCDMNILDETVGRMNWQRRHYECKGNLFCSIGIRESKDWTWKDDAGAESNMEKEKGEASDSFKRAGTNWGIGRELYTAPFIWVPLETEKTPGVIVEKAKDRYVTEDTFEVRKITYWKQNEKNIHVIKDIAILRRGKGRKPAIVYVHQGNKVESISLILNDKSLYLVTECQVKHWEELFPVVDVMQELRNMAAWCEANPQKRKTKSGILRFITGWLSKEQNKGGNRMTSKVKRSCASYNLSEIEDLSHFDLPKNL